MDTLHLVATERHVEAALRDNRTARTFRSWIRAMAGRSALSPATPEVTRLATALALGAAAHAGLPANDEANPALVGPIDDALGALRRAGVSSEILARTGAPRAEMLARLLEDTGARLAQTGLYDDRAAGWTAAEFLEGALQNELPDRVVIEGLVDWQPAEFAWVEALSARVPTVVRLPHFRGASTEAYADDALLGLVEQRWESQPSAPELELEDISLPAPELIVAAESPEAECRAIARALRDGLERGANAERIAVVVPALDEAFLEPLRAALEEASVPFVEPRGRPPAAAPVARGALGWLDLAVGPVHRDALLDILQAPAIDPRAWTEAASGAPSRERALLLARRLAQIPVGADHEGAMLLSALGAWVRERPADGWMRAGLGQILADLRELGLAAARPAIAVKLRRAFSNMGLADVPREALRSLLRAEAGGREAVVLVKSIRDRAMAMRAIHGAIERVEHAASVLGCAGDEVSVATFRAELHAALAAAEPEGGFVRAGAVRIARASEVMGLSMDLVVVARASEGALGGRGSPALVEEELARALPRASRPHTARSSAGVRRTELGLAMSRATRLVVTRSVNDAEGRADPPAPLFNWLAEHREIVREPTSIVSAVGAAVSKRHAYLRSLAASGEPEDEDQARRVAVERARLAFFLDPQRLSSDVTGGIDVSDPVTGEHLRRAFGGDRERPIAATAIERAANCRFAGFAARVLRATAGEESTEDVAPWQRGSLVHRALQIAFETMRAFWGKLAPADLSRMAIQSVHESMVRGQASPLYRAEVERAVRDVAAVVAWSLDQGGDLPFAHGERSFGRAGGWPPLEIRGSTAPIFVEGRIDRVDALPDGTRARVIDYKSGTPPPWSHVGTRAFQPPLYASVVRRELGPLLVRDLRALYLDTSKRPPRALPAAEKSQVLSPEMVRNAEANAAAIVERLWRGDVAPRPVDAAVCTRCEARDICRRPAAMPIDELDPEADGAM